VIYRTRSRASPAKPKAPAWKGSLAPWLTKHPDPSLTASSRRAAGPRRRRRTWDQTAVVWLGRPLLPRRPRSLAASARSHSQPGTLALGYSFGRGSPEELEPRHGKRRLRELAARSGAGFLWRVVSPRAQSPGWMARGGGESSAQKPTGISSWKAFGRPRHWARGSFPGSKNNCLTVSPPSLCLFVKHLAAGELTLTLIHREQQWAGVSKGTWQVDESSRGFSFTGHVWGKKINS